MNEVLKSNNWWIRNWKWLTPIIGFLIFIYLIFSSTDIGKNSFDVVKAYADPDLVEIALDKAQKNEEVIEILGTLQPIDKMAKLEGLVKYSNNDTHVEISVRVKGDKEKGLMRIIADRKGETWKYSKVFIGIKRLKKTIHIVEN